jgi:hypothetical protein
MNEQLHGLLKDLFILLRDKYGESLVEETEAGSASDAAYRQGATFAYYDALALIRSQLIAAGYDEEASRLSMPEFGKPYRGGA